MGKTRVEEINTSAKEIVEDAEDLGYSHKRIAEICKVSIGTVSRWKTEGYARSNDIGRLEDELEGNDELEDEMVKHRKYLDDATLEDIAARARQLGFRVSFADINEYPNNLQETTMTSIPKYQTCPEYAQHFVGFKNVCFAPYATYIRKRERVIVQYPFVKLVMDGALSSLPGFETLTERSMAIYCSFETRLPTIKTRSLDILVFSKSADVFLFECKVRTGATKDSTALRKLGKGSEQLVEYAAVLKDFGGKLLENPIGLLSRCHYHRYTTLHEFPAFNKFISESLQIEDKTEQEEWCEKIANRMATGKVKYGFVFNGPEDGDTGVVGYDHIPKSDIAVSVLQGWDESVGDLNIFMVDYINETCSRLQAG